MFEHPAFDSHEQVVHASDEETGLTAIIAVHDTTLGPGLGGTRMRAYDSEEAALNDVLRLSSAMTAKAAAADLELGGGKAVIIGEPEKKDEALLRAYGRAVDRLAGRYITSVDVNTDVSDMDIIADETPYVTGRSDGLGDPSPITAQGVMYGIRACIEQVSGRQSLADVHVAIQGLGKVGTNLAEELLDRGATVSVTDIHDDHLEPFEEVSDARIVEPDSIYDVDCDVFAPCAFGGAVNDETIPRLNCDIVAGAANNILASESRHSQVLHDNDMLYVPDYVLNAGGLITVATEYFGGTREEAFAEAQQIESRVHRLIEQAKEQDITVLESAQRYVENRLATTSQQPTQAVSSR